MVPAPDAKQLWRKLHVRDVQKSNGKQETKNVRIDILVGGNTGGKDWECGLEFDFANDESFQCRPLRTSNGSQPSRMLIPDEASDVQVAFLPPMSGLASNETRLDSGAINVRLGEGRTAEVLRNLCYALWQKQQSELMNDETDVSFEGWSKVVYQMKELFGVTLEVPEYIPERGEIQMAYRDRLDIQLDLSGSGRGLQQTLLLLVYLALHPKSVLLLDEPDAHLEILRQRDLYLKLREAARESGSQLIVASHSEEVLNQAAGLDEGSVVAFLGRPHRIPENRTPRVRSALNSVRYDQYYQAEQVGWVLYLESYTDLNILRAFAEKLNHPAKESLRSPFLVPIGNVMKHAREHFHSLKEAKPDLLAFLIVDNDAGQPQEIPGLDERKWRRKEIENYICQPETLESYAHAIGAARAGIPLLEEASVLQAVEAMRESVRDRVTPAALRDRNDPWWTTVKASDQFLDLVFPDFHRRLGSYMDFKKADYYRLVPHIPDSMVADEIVAVLDGIARIASGACPAIS
jgi:hypothetical protein